MGEHTGKAYRRGTHRQISPRDTLARVEPFLGKMGITRLANVTGLDSIGIPVVLACRPNSRSLAVSQGKGLELDAAKASAVMETTESYHAENIILPLRLGTFHDLRARECVVDVDAIPRPFGSAFRSDLPLLWIEGDDWLQRERVWVPFQIVHTVYTTSMRFDLNCFTCSSNGLASGNHLLEAASHAICEVIERDADARFSRLFETEQEARRVDLTTVDDPDCQNVLARYVRAGVAVAVWDTTSDVGVASFRCLITDRSDDLLRPVSPTMGMGCHPVRHIALLRALTEAAQSRLTVISGARDDAPRQEYIVATEATNRDIMRRRALIEGERPFCRTPSFETDTFEEDVAWELGQLRRAGRDRVVLVDLTLPDIGLAVVRAVIPGMEFESGAAGRRRPAAM
jgi:ribosomal protein S12 methylthiotransferase accessory factor